MTAYQATMQGLHGPQPWRLLLLLKGQCILYRRYGDVLEPFKYAGYPMLLNAVTVDNDDTNFLSSERAPLLVAASELVWLTYNPVTFFCLIHDYACKFYYTFW